MKSLPPASLTDEDRQAWLIALYRLARGMMHNYELLLLVYRDADRRDAELMLVGCRDHARLIWRPADCELLGRDLFYGWDLPL